MRILILFFIVSNAFGADRILTVIPNSGATMESEFADDSLAMSDLCARIEAKEWMQCSYQTDQTGTICDAKSFEIGSEMIPVMEDRFCMPSTFTFTLTDKPAIDPMLAYEKVAIEKLSCAVTVKAYVGALNLFLGKTQAEIQAIMTTYSDVVKLLDAGALDTALVLITSLPVTVEIDQAYKDSVIAKINSCNVSI